MTPADELSRLDAVLARIAGDAEQTEAFHKILGGYSHQARNVLNGLKMSLYLATREADPAAVEVWQMLDHRYHALERFFERLQQLWRASPLTRVNLPFDLLIEERRPGWVKVLGRRGLTLVSDPPERESVSGFDPSRLGQALDDLVAWRARVGAPGAELRVRWGVEGGRFRLEWDEPADGDAGRNGLPCAAPGCDREPSDLLAVPLLTRAVSLHGGRLDALETSPWRIAYSWPQAELHPA